MSKLSGFKILVLTSKESELLLRLVRNKLDEEYSYRFGSRELIERLHDLKERLT